jgi:hypothetical protein
VAHALLDGRRHDDDLLGELGQRAFGRPGHEVDGPGEGTGRLERESRRPLVADRDEDVRLGRRDDRVERLHRVPARLGRVERRPAAREDDAAGRQAPVADAGRDAA